MEITNPIIKGFNPDPSIAKVNGKYYLATSTFEWFPGIQIFESTNLKSWQLIARPLDSVSKLDMKGDPDSGGVWAPDLSYHDGKFWIIYSDCKVAVGVFKDVHNYLITSDSIAGPWSDPVYLGDSGCDASLFVDENTGKAYIVNRYWDPRPYNHHFYGIELTEFDFQTMQLLTETSRIIFKGTDAKYVEGPHIYQKDGWYYLFAAQGGTHYEHQEVVARSHELDGPYEVQPGDPFLTTVDNPYHPFQKAGHGDIVQDDDGNYYYFHLLARPVHRDNQSFLSPRGYCPLGREVGIQNMEWQTGEWPHIIGGHNGQLTIHGPNVKKSTNVKTYEIKDEFESTSLNINFQTLRVPFSQFGSLTDRPGYLRLYGRESLNSTFVQAHVARRWESLNFEAETCVEFEPMNIQQLAGMSNYYNTQNWSALTILWDDEVGKALDVWQSDHDNVTSHLKQNVVKIPNSVERIYLKTIVKNNQFWYKYSFDGEKWTEIGHPIPTYKLSDEYIQENYGADFTGAFVGMFNIDGIGVNQPADFDYFKYLEH